MLRKLYVQLGHLPISDRISKTQLHSILRAPGFQSSVNMVERTVGVRKHCFKGSC